MYTLDASGKLLVIFELCSVQMSCCGCCIGVDVETRQNQNRIDSDGQHLRMAFFYDFQSLHKLERPNPPNVLVSHYSWSVGRTKSWDNYTATTSLILS